MEIIPPGINYDFVGTRRLFATISIALMIVSVLLIIFVGPNYGIDFRGGTNIILRFNESMDPADVHGSMIDMGFDDAIVQSFGPASSNMFLVQTNRISSITPGDAERVRQALVAQFGTEGLSFSYDQDSGDRIEVRLPAGSLDNLPDWEGTGEGTGAAADDSEAGVIPPEDEAQQASPQRAYLEHILTEAGLTNPRVSQDGNPRQNRFLIRLQRLQDEVETGLVTDFGARFANVERIETVGARVGAQLRNDGVKAVGLALFFILLYVGFRFNMRFAPGAVICLFHDVLLTLGILVALGEEVTLTTLAALLTIIGYSLNDTIVIFDRIREHMGPRGSTNLEQLVNRSLNETLSRTVLVSATTFVAVLAIYFLGGGLIQSFALAMILGIVIGTYSSIYVATPIFIWLTRTLEARTSRQRDSKDAARRARVRRTTP